MRRKAWAGLPATAPPMFAPPPKLRPALKLAPAEAPAPPPPAPAEALAEALRFRLRPPPAEAPPVDPPPIATRLTNPTLLKVCDVQHALKRSIEARSMTRSNLKLVTSNGYFRLSTSWSVVAERQLYHSSPPCFL